MKRKRIVQAVKQELRSGKRQPKKDLLENIAKALARRGIKKER